MKPFTSMMLALLLIVVSLLLGATYVFDLTVRHHNSVLFDAFFLAMNVITFGFAILIIRNSLAIHASRAKIEALDELIAAARKRNNTP